MEPQPHREGRSKLPIWLLRSLGHCVRWITQTFGRKWGSRVLVRLPKPLTRFETIVSYRHVKFAVDTAEYLGRSLFYFDEYERAQETLFAELGEKRTVFDIGANIGVFTMLAALNGARVFAFEPSRLVRARLERNVALNVFGEAVTVVGHAVSDVPGTLPFYESRMDNSGIGRVFSFDQGESRPADYDVHADTIDAFVQQFGKPDVIKIDIEGAEWLALAGAAKTLSAKNAPQLLIEFHPAEIRALGGTVDHCLNTLQAYGYKRYDIVGAAAGTHTWSCFSKGQPETKRLKLH